MVSQGGRQRAGPGRRAAGRLLERRVRGMAACPPRSSSYRRRRDHGRRPVSVKRSWGQASTCSGHRPSRVPPGVPPRQIRGRRQERTSIRKRPSAQHPAAIQQQFVDNERRPPHKARFGKSCGEPAGPITGLGAGLSLNTSKSGLNASKQRHAAPPPAPCTR